MNDIPVIDNVDPPRQVQCCGQVLLDQNDGLAGGNDRGKELRAIGPTLTRLLRPFRRPGKGDCIPRP